MAKRIFQVVVLFFAIYSFVFVPLGKKTALEHVQAIVGTPAARDAASEIKGGVTRLVRRLQTDARQSTEETDRLLDEPTAADDVDPSPAREPSPLPSLPKPKQLRSLSAEKPAHERR